MRQKNDLVFAEALNKLGEDGVLGLSDEQIKLFDSRIVRNMRDIPNEAFILMHSNKEVEHENSYKIENAPGELTVNEAIDYPVGKDKDKPIAINAARNCQNLKLEDTCNLPNNIRFKVNCKYMISNNSDVSDGIVNGATGVLKKIVKTNNKTETKPLVKRVWIDFGDINVGLKTRKENRELFAKDSISRANEWTPIECNALTIKQSEGGRYHVDRLQFSIVECEAMTIHKSQGQTYSIVAVGIDGHLTRALLYVSMSRVTSLDGLYLVGNRNSILRDEFKNKSEKERLAINKSKLEFDQVKIEMTRMRLHSKLENVFPFLIECTAHIYDQTDSIMIMFHNIRAFNQNKQINVMKDYGFMKADIIMLVETHTNLNYVRHVNLDGYQTRLITGTRQKCQSNGQICFAKHYIADNFMNVAHNSNDQFESLNKLIEISLFRYNTVHKVIYICLVYKHPTMSFGEFYNEFSIFLKENLNFNMHDNLCDNPHLFVLGDFNIDFNLKKNFLNKITFELGLYPIFKETPTTDLNKNQIDWCFTNVSTEDFSFKFDSGAYESWFSDHKPIWLKIETH